LIGTVGNRALIYKPDGSTVVVAVGEEIDSDNGKIVKIETITPKQAEISIDGKKKILTLQTAASLASRAAQSREQPSEKGKKDASSSSSASKESGVPSGAVKLPVGK
jgi:hypothetical protein